MNNIVIFGPTQSGKSTLIGYLASRCYSNEDFNREVKKKIKLIKALNVGEFRKDMVLPSFVSIDRDELMRLPNQNAIGTTKKVHRQRISIESAISNNISFIFIDTPGTRLTLYEKYKGIFEGDVGVCVLSCIDVDKWIAELDDDQKDKLWRRLFEPIQFWSIYKDPQKLIVVLSKVDCLKQNSQSIKSSLRDMLENLNKELKSISTNILPPLPIGIEIEQEGDNYVVSDINIYRVDEHYKDISYSFIELLSRIIDQRAITCIENKEFKLACVENIRSVKYLGEKAIRVKVLDGCIKKGDRIYVSPVKMKNDNSLFTVQGIVKSLKYEKGDDTLTIQEGNIGGIVLSNISLLNSSKYSSIEMSKLKIVKSTIVFSGEFIEGNSICLEFDAEEMSNDIQLSINDLQPYDKINIVWFGKMIETFLLHKCWMAGKYIFKLCINNYNNNDSLKQFVIPLGEGPLVGANVLMIMPFYDDPCHSKIFINTRLSNIIRIIDSKKYAVSVDFENEYFENQEQFSTSLSMIGFNSLMKTNFDVDKCQISFAPLTSNDISAVLKSLKKYLKSNFIELGQLNFEDYLETNNEL